MWNIQTFAKSRFSKLSAQLVKKQKYAKKPKNILIENINSLADVLNNDLCCKNDVKCIIKMKNTKPTPKSITQRKPI